MQEAKDRIEYKPKQPEVGSHEDLTVGLVLPFTVDGATAHFRIEDVQPDYIRIRAVSAPPPGRRWNLKKLPYNTRFTLGDLAFVKAGATSKTAKLRPEGE